MVIKGPGGAERGRVRYQHSQSTPTGSVITIASGFTPQLTSQNIGITANEGPPWSPCAWSAYHAHQEQTSGGTWTKLSYPDEDTCNAPNDMEDCDTYDINLYAMLRLNWSQ